MGVTNPLFVTLLCVGKAPVKRHSLLGGHSVVEPLPSKHKAQDPIPSTSRTPAPHQAS